MATDEVQSQHRTRHFGLHCIEVYYQRAIELALPKKGLQYQREVEVPATYDGKE